MGEWVGGECAVTASLEVAFRVCRDQSVGTFYNTDSITGNNSYILCILTNFLLALGFWLSFFVRPDGALELSVNDVEC